MTKLKMKSLASLLAACLLLAALAGCSNTKSGSANNGATGTPTSYTNGQGYGLDNYGGQGYGNGMSTGKGLGTSSNSGYTGATNSSYRSNGGTVTTPGSALDGAINNTMRGLDNMTGGSVSADM